MGSVKSARAAENGHNSMRLGAEIYDVYDQQQRFLHIGVSQEGGELLLRPEGRQRHLVNICWHHSGFPLTAGIDAPRQHARAFE